MGGQQFLLHCSVPKTRKCSINVRYLAADNSSPGGLNLDQERAAIATWVRGQHLGHRFWQARAVESFLRGTTSYADQMFLLKRGLLEVWLRNWGVRWPSSLAPFSEFSS